MLRLPSRFATVILSFAPLFFQRSWRHAEVLLVGAILAPGKRTVTSLLRISGLARERRFVSYHRILNRAVWSLRAASRLLLGRLVAAFAPVGPVVLGIDDTIERRRGKRIAAKGIYRDPVRSSHGHFAQGVRPALAQPDAADAPRSATAASAAASTRNSQSGHASSCSRPAAGSRAGISCWWATAALPPWNCWPPWPGTR